MSQSEEKIGFISHLTELRKRLIHSFIFLIKNQINPPNKNYQANSTFMMINKERVS